MTSRSPRNKLLTWLTILALAPLTACERESSKPTTSCGILFKYDKATEQQAAREYEAMRTAGTFPVTRELIDDYGKTRQSIRDCQ